MANVSVTKRKVALMVLAPFTMAIGGYYIYGSVDYLHNAVGTEHSNFSFELNRCSALIQAEIPARSKSLTTANTTANENGFSNSTNESWTELEDVKDARAVAVGSNILNKLTKLKPFFPHITSFVAKATDARLTPFCRVIREEVAAGYMTLAIGICMVLLGFSSLVLNILCIFDKFAVLRPFPIYIVGTASVLGVICGVGAYGLVQYARDEYIIWRNSFIPREACSILCKYIPIHSALYDNSMVYTSSGLPNPGAWITKTEGSAFRINATVAAFILCLILNGVASVFVVFILAFMGVLEID